MARDCPDRQRGANWRNGPPAPGGGKVGSGDAVDREMEVSARLRGIQTFSNYFTNKRLSNLCKNSEAALLPLLESKLVLVRKATATALSHGIADQLENLPHGKLATKTLAMVDHPSHPGLEIG